jgi:FAD/FMN-containing dehydrogenase
MTSVMPSCQTQINHPRPPWFKRYRIIIILLVLIVGIFLFVAGRPLFHLTLTVWSDVQDQKVVPVGRADDVSRLNEVEATVIPISSEAIAAEQQLSQLLREAQQRNLRVAIAGARHSQGGHTLYSSGLVLNMLPFNRVEIDTQKRLIRAQSGALWSYIIPRLDAVGLAIDIMQSDSDFTVGGSLSVNCHGWQPGKPPIASTVQSLRLMLADGSVVTCSRTERPELFASALGGYGLIGIILEAEIQVVPNACYRLERKVILADQYAERYRDMVLKKSDCGLVYGRLCVAKDNFLHEAIITVAHEIPAPSSGVPPVQSPSISALKRAIFRGSVNNDYGKHLRWQAERDWQSFVTPALITRNEMMNGTANEYINRADHQTDVLQEYFIPMANLATFLTRMREIIPRHSGDLLNATVREVRRDPDTLLRYADQDMFAVVLFFSMERNVAADQHMTLLTQALIDAALDLGGRYYLPYRLHATTEQFTRAYPQAVNFFQAKRRFDPGELFQNEFYRRYAPK